MRNWREGIAAGHTLVQQVMALDKVKQGLDKAAVTAELTKLFADLSVRWDSGLKVSVEFCDVHALMNKTWHTELACVSLEGRDCRLFFHERLLSLTDPNAGLIFAGYCWVLLLVIDYANSLGSPLRGHFVFEAGDNGGLDAVAFCSNSRNPCLIMDHSFAAAEGYADFRKICERAAPSWQERIGKVFWRGGTTGQRLKTPPGAGRPDDLSWLQRLQLCIAAAAPSVASHCDIGISGIVQVPEQHLVERIMASNIRRTGVPREAFMRYKVLVDIDGNSNAWSGLFCSLLGGSCVLKVASPGGYRQWYYDQLKPREHFLPVNADLSDFETAVLWAIDHDGEAAAIAARGRALSSQITFEQALDASARRLAQWLAARAAVQAPIANPD